MCSHKDTNSCSMGFMTRQKSHFTPPKCRKWVRTKPGTLEREFQDSAVNVFIKAPKCTKWAHAMCRSCLSLTFDPGHEFGLFAWRLNLDLELKLSHFQVTIKEKKCSHEATYPWSMGFTSPKNHIFKPPKCRKWVRTKLGTLESEFEDLGVNIFSGGQIARSEISRCVIRVWPWQRIWYFRMTMN